MSTAQEARREERFPVPEKQILLMRWGGARAYESHRVRLLDCSAHGLAVEDTDPMEAGDQFVLYMHLKEVTMVLYTARHCVKLDSGRYKIGAKLEGFIGPGAAKADMVLTALIAQRLV